jgi:hypothetical protein
LNEITQVVIHDIFFILEEKEIVAEQVKIYLKNLQEKLKNEDNKI